MCSEKCASRGRLMKAAALSAKSFRRNLILSALALITCAAIIYNWQCRGSTPTGVARDAAQALIRGDVAWLWARASEEEKSIPGMSEAIISEFYREFLTERLENAQIGEIQHFGETAWQAGTGVTVVTADGGEFLVPVVGVVDQGREIIGVVQSIVGLASHLAFTATEPDGIERTRLGWAKYGPWFRSKGVHKWFYIQSWELLDMPSQQTR
jgi:hypothetical protein